MTDGFTAGFVGAAGIAVAGGLLVMITIRAPRTTEPTATEATRELATRR